MKDRIKSEDLNQATAECGFFHTVFLTLFPCSSDSAVATLSVQSMMIRNREKDCFKIFTSQKHRQL